MEGGGNFLKNSIRRRITLSIFTVIFITILIFEAVFIIGVRQFYYGRALGILSDKAVSIANFYNMYLRYEDLYRKGTVILDNYEEKDRAELQIVDIEGNIIVSSAGFLHTEKVDVKSIRTLKVGEFHSWRGRLDTIDGEILIVSTPLIMGNSNTIVGFIRLVSSIEEITITVKDLILKSVFLSTLFWFCHLSGVFTVRKHCKTYKTPHLCFRSIADGNFDIVADKNIMMK